MKIVLFGRNPYLMTSLEKRKAECCFEFLGSAEMLNHKLNAGRGFHPRRCGSPDAITPEQVLRHYL